MSDCYLHLARRYPSSKVVLTTRDPVKWLESSKATILRVNDALYGVIVHWVPLLREQRKLWTEGSGPLYQRRYGGYVEQAMNMRIAEAKAALPEDRLLIFQVQQGVG